MDANCSFWEEMARIALLWGQLPQLPCHLRLLPLSFACDSHESQEVWRAFTRESNCRGPRKGLGKKVKYFKILVLLWLSL